MTCRSRDLAITQALSKVKEGDHEWAATTWSPLYINLGQVYRIAKQYDQALKCFKHAQFLACDNSTVYTGLGELIDVSLELYLILLFL